MGGVGGDEYKGILLIIYFDYIFWLMLLVSVNMLYCWRVSGFLIFVIVSEMIWKFIKGIYLLF